MCEEATEFLATGGLIRRRLQGTVEWRLDTGRAFERLLLSSAPAGTLPPGISVF
jgi:hypothetical protein